MPFTTNILFVFDGVTFQVRFWSTTRNRSYDCLSQNNTVENQNLHFNVKSHSFHTFLNLFFLLPEVENTSVPTVHTQFFEMYKTQKFGVTMTANRKSDIKDFLQPNEA